MHSMVSKIRTAAGIGLVTILCLTLQSGPTGEEAPKPNDLQTKLGGAERYLAHVSTDKPIYKAGEEVYVRAVVVNALSCRPLLQDLFGQVEIVSPRGDVVNRGQAAMKDGALGYKWKIEEGVAGGDYIAKVSFPLLGFPPAEREFNIRAYRQRRLRTQIEFAREGYGPGDEVTATLECSRSEGGIPAGAQATVVARVDEREAWRGKTTIGADGFATVRFPLPYTIERGDGTLSFAIEDGGVVETAAKTIPILVATVDLQAYPEGGDLVAGIENRLYFEAIAPNGRPADVTVELYDSNGASLATAKTEHEGRGSLTFRPVAETTYTLRVVEPWTVTTETTLPPVVGVAAIRATEQRYAAGGPIRVEVGPPRSYWIAAAIRDRVVASTTVQPGDAQGDWIPVRLDLPSTASGVLRVTVYDIANKGLPVAERLVYREPADVVQIAVEAEQGTYIPGDKVRLHIRTTDKSGTPVPAFVGLTVTDDALLEMVETREQAPRLPIMVYVEPEVRELADAHVYLSDDPEAPRALDLLLGTQGWRRFAFVDVDKFLAEHGDAARRVLAQRPSDAPDMSSVSNYAVYWAAPKGGADNFRWNMNGVARGEEGKQMVQLFALADGEGVRERAQAGEVVEKLAEVRKGLPAVPPVEAAEVVKEEPEPAVDAKPARQDAADEAVKQLEEIAMDPVARMEMDIAEEEQMAGLVLGRRLNQAAPQLIAVRVYAHRARPDRQPNDRIDFTETLYWSAALATGDGGLTSVTFDLSDSVTTFRAIADAYTGEGVFGASDAVVESVRPFYCEVKAPLECTAGDRIDMPVVIVNETDKAMEAGLIVSAAEGVSFEEGDRMVKLPARSRRRVIIPATVQSKAGLSELLVSAEAGAFSEHLSRKVPVKPLGFPVSINYGGMLEKEVGHKVAIPKSVTDGGIEATAAVYPTPLANLTEALEALIRDPNGCFEQTSSTNYPLVMAMQYFETHTGVDPELVRRSREKLAAGYKRLVGYECKKLGYEWFGGDPGHEALTAYGLLEFEDMAEVHPVDPQMIERTRQWLLDRRDGKGGFERNPRALDSFGGAPDDVTNAYIVWALAVSGEKGIEQELDAVRDLAKKSEDPYILALVAGSLIHADRGEEATPILKRLASMQNKEGAVEGAATTITRSGGESLLIETTSLAILAWLSDGDYAANVERGMNWLAERCKAGRFGATQSTVLALKAIVEYDKSRAKPLADGELTLLVNGVEVETKPFTKDTQGAIEFTDFTRFLTPGTHTIGFRMKGGSPMPYSLAVEYHAEKPVDSATCPVTLQTQIAKAKVNEGEPVEVVATLRNTTDKGQPMTMAIVGLPGGLEPRHEQLKESVEAGKFDFYEVIGRDVCLYFRDLAPNAEHRIVISTIAAAPGEYTGPAGRAYLYYTPEEKKWCDPVKVAIAPMKNEK